MERVIRERPPGGRISDEDARLWREVTRAVRPLPGRSAPPAPPADEPLAAAPGAIAAAAPAAAPPAPAPLPEAAHGALAGLDKRSATRLRRGQLPIEARIDLHGMTQAEAHAALDAFISGSHAAGRRVVLVITGRGFNPAARRHGEATGVLRQAVPRWLHEGANRGRVLTYASARPKDGGAGALYVLLRRRRE